LAASGSFISWLDQPLLGRRCLLGWLLATTVFLGIVALFGGPSSNDAGESTYSTWAIAHGDFGCAYPHVDQEMARNYLSIYLPAPHVPPLWPLISGAVAAVGRIGGSVPFPPAHVLGPSCTSAYSGIFFWAHTNRVLSPTLGIGYLSWFALLAGVIAVLRSSGRGRRGWEVLGVFLVALTPVVWEPILVEFHPQDLLAMGLVLGGVACFQRRWWAWSGVLLGLALTSQQFALLVLAPLFVLALGGRRWRLAGGAAGMWLLVGLPFVVIDGRNALSGLLFGTGDSFTFGGTVLWETGLRGHLLVVCSRVLPICLSVAIAWLAVHRLGKRVFEPAILLSLLATSLSLRLVFEQGLFGYKFMPLGVMLVVLCVVRGKRIGETLTWLVLVTLAWNPIPFGLAFNARSWGHSVAVALPLVATAVILGPMIWDARRRRARWYLATALLIVLIIFVHWPPWMAQLRAPWPKWLLQIMLLPAGIVLAVEPLVSAMRSRSDQLSDLTADPAIGVTTTGATASP
jgi:hypothetical protein